MRLKSSRDIDRVFKAKQSVGTKFFVLYFIENQEDGVRLAKIVSKRVSKKAVERNRIRRQIHEYVRLHQNQIDSHDLVVIARSGAASLENSACRNDLNTLFRRYQKRLASL